MYIGEKIEKPAVGDTHTPTHARTHKSAKEAAHSGPTGATQAKDRERGKGKGATKETTRKRKNNSHQGTNTGNRKHEERGREHEQGRGRGVRIGRRFVSWGGFGRAATRTRGRVWAERRARGKNKPPTRFALVLFVWLVCLIESSLCEEEYKGRRKQRKKHCARDLCFFSSLCLLAGGRGATGAGAAPGVSGSERLQSRTNKRTQRPKASKHQHSKRCPLSHRFCSIRSLTIQFDRNPPTHHPPRVLLFSPACVSAIKSARGDHHTPSSHHRWIYVCPVLGINPATERINHTPTHTPHTNRMGKKSGASAGKGKRAAAAASEVSKR